MLTLENIKMHDKHINDTNTQFYPRINKLQELANKRFNGVMRTSTNFTGTFSIFDALYEMESFNQLPVLEQSSSQTTMSQERPVMSQDQFRDALLTKMLQVDNIE